MLCRLAGFLVLGFASLLSQETPSEGKVPQPGDPKEQSSLLWEKPVVIAHLSDTHLGMKRAPDAADTLMQAVEMINLRHPDAVILTGDIGDQYEESWTKAREIFKELKAPIFYLPGNHDDTTKTQERYKKIFHSNYYSFDVRFVHFVALDSQLLGNWENIDSETPEVVYREDADSAEKMLQWIEKDGAELKSRQAKDPRLGKVTVAVQHVPPDRNRTGAPDARPYWVLHEPWSTRELAALRGIGVTHIFAGHWHKGINYSKDGFKYHIAPATSWSPSSPLGFYIHSISSNGDVQTTVVYLRVDDPPSKNLRAAK